MTGNTVHAQSHQVLGALCLLSLAPVQISVHMDVDLLGKPPKADILLLRREGEAWNAAQRARLPDGVRDSAAAHVLVEFKYTESVNETALAQAVSYDHFYRQGQRLSEEQALTVLLSARTPRKDRLEKWGYEEEQKGVFCSQLPLLRRVRLLVLNRLPPQPHNAFVKLFASRKREREAAFASLDMPMVAESPDLHAYMVGLQTALEVKGEVNMAEMLTPEKVMEIGKEVRQRILEWASPEDINETLRQRILEMASPEERMMGLDLNKVNPKLRQRILEMASPEERLSGLDPNEILAGINTAERRTLLRLLQEEVDAVAGDETSRTGDAA
jgi:hypothetical protein